MHTGPRVTWEQSESSSRLETDEPARAATAYLAWPLALFELARASGASLWYRAHLRQAAALGMICTLVILVLLALPLSVVLALGPGDGATILIYAVALVLDAVAFGIIAWLCVHCAIRASRGQLFSIRYVAPLGERLFRRREH